MPQPLKFEMGKKPHFIGAASQHLNPIYDWHCHALMVSEGHCPGAKTGRYDKTGNFYTWKRNVWHLGDTNFRFGSSSYSIAGVAGCSTGPGSFNPSTSIPSFATATSGLSAQYASGYARARPGNPVASAAQFIAELRDLPAAPFRSFFLKPGRNRRYGPLTVPIVELPKLLHQRALTFKNLGSEYLNYVFGWAPFVGDLRKMYYLWHDIDKRMAQIVRENGKPLTRKARVLSETTVERGGSVSSLHEITDNDAALEYDWTPKSVHLPSRTLRNLRGTRLQVDDDQLSESRPFPFYGVFGAPSSLALKGTTLHSVMRVSQTKEWFTGKFRYYIPDVGSSQWNKATRLALFGAIPTPSTVWELMPWSWLIDWFTNVGDVISNLSPNAVGGTPALLMSGIHRTVFQKTQHFVSTNVEDPVGVNVGKWKGGSYTFESNDLTFSKSRIGSGNPYGLNLKIDSLSKSQLAVLAALGISRGKVR